MHWFIEGGPWMYPILATDIVVGSAAGVVLLIAILSRFVPVVRWPARIVAGLVLLGDAAGFVDRHHPELSGSFLDWHLEAADGHIGFLLGVKSQERAVVHLVYVITGEDEHEEDEH